MNVKLDHYFQTTAHDLLGLFDGTAKFSQFMSKLQKQSKLDPDRYDSNKYVGDGFEFFVELFLKLHPCDNRVGVYNYTPHNGTDIGADGYGINILGEPCAVQVKFRSDASGVLTANNDHLSNLFSAAQIQKGISIDLTNKNKRNFKLFVFTTAKGLHHYTDKVQFEGFVRCFGYNEFKSMLDNNMVFWSMCNKICKDIVESQKKAK